MITFFRSYAVALWCNPYARMSALLCLCYVVANAFSIDRFDYILVLYVLTQPYINEDTALKYAIVFGIFYDLNSQIFFGLGILTFMGLNVLKIYIFQLIDMSKPHYRLLYSAGLIMLYVILTLKYYGFPSATYWVSVAYYTVMNIMAVSVCWLILAVVRGRLNALSAS